MDNFWCACSFTFSFVFPRPEAEFSLSWLELRKVEQMSREMTCLPLSACKKKFCLELQTEFSFRYGRSEVISQECMFCFNNRETTAYMSTPAVHLQTPIVALSCVPLQSWRLPGTKTDANFESVFNWQWTAYFLALGPPTQPRE